jgi:hypothetical protein
MLPNDAVVRHWTLNLAVKFPVPLWLLFPVVREESLNVKAVPGLAADDYAAVLQGLLSDKMIQITGAEIENPNDWANTVRLLSHLPIAPGWEMAKMPGGQISFELTPRGGDVWERRAEPDWNHILIESSDLESCELLSPDRNQLMAYMGWYRELRDQAIDLETVKLTRRTNFPILYWKQLASVYHASFHLYPTPRDSANRRCALPWLNEWAALKWYRHPWDLPDWPQ